MNWLSRCPPGSVVRSVMSTSSVMSRAASLKWPAPPRRTGAPRMRPELQCPFESPPPRGRARGRCGLAVCAARLNMNDEERVALDPAMAPDPVGQLQPCRQGWLLTDAGRQDELCRESADGLLTALNGVLMACPHSKSGGWVPPPGTPQTPHREVT